MGKLKRWLKIAAECSNDGPAELDTRIVVPLSARERCTSKTAGQQIYIACQICRDTNAAANRTDNGMTELQHGAMVGPNTPTIAIAERVKQVEQPGLRC